MPSNTFSTSAAQLTATSTPVTYGVQLITDAANTGTVYVGFANTVTAGTAGATDGLPIPAGQNLLIPKSKVSDANAIYIIGSAASQKVFYEVF